MNLEEEFNKIVKGWKEHCGKTEVMVSSSIQSIRNCNPYRKIVELGYKALPLIRKLYDENMPKYLEQK